MAEVILENLYKRYRGGAVAVDTLNLHMPDGELLAIVGPSGCGKTTTLRLIAGLESPTEGLVRIDGINVNTVSPGKRNVAMVFQDHSLYPHMSVRKNMHFGLKMRRIPSGERAEKVTAAAEALGIAHLLDRRPGELSGGEQQRAALGKALVQRPQVFLLDEPLSNLDPTLRRELRQVIRILHRQINATMIFVTHDQEEALTLGDRVAVMRNGAIQQIGSPLEVYDKPVNRFVAGFIGTPAMNFIDGRIERSEAGLVFTNERDVRIPVAASHAVLLQYKADQPVTAGIRPGHVMDAAHANDRCVPLWLRVLHVEPVGGHTLLHLQTADGTPFCAQVTGRRNDQPDRHATLCLNPEDVQYFEPGEDGVSLTHGLAAVGV